MLPAFQAEFISKTDKSIQYSVAYHFSAAMQYWRQAMAACRISGRAAGERKDYDEISGNGGGANAGRFFNQYGSKGTEYVTRR